MSNLSYAVVGSGAIGGYYGGKLAHAGQEVHFLLHSDYAQALQQGLRVDSVDGNFCLQKPNIYRSTEDMPQADVVLVGLKTVNNHLLPQLLRPLLKADTHIVLIQNGMDMEADLSEVLPHQPIIGAMAFICSNKVRPAHIRHLDYGALTLGCHQWVDERKLSLIADDFTAAGISVSMDPDLHTARWKKLVWNIPYNGLTVVLGSTTDQLMNHPQSRTLVRQLMEEVIRAAQTCGAQIDSDFADQMMSNTDQMKPYKPSMLLDFEHHRPMEVDYMYDRPIRRAAAHGAAMPLKQMLAWQLRFTESKNQTAP